MWSAASVSPRSARCSAGPHDSRACVRRGRGPARRSRPRRPHRASRARGRVPGRRAWLAARVPAMKSAKLTAKVASAERNREIRAFCRDWRRGELKPDGAGSFLLTESAPAAPTAPAKAIAAELVEACLAQDWLEREGESASPLPCWQGVAAPVSGRRRCVPRAASGERKRRARDRRHVPPSSVERGRKPSRLAQEPQGSEWKPVAHRAAIRGRGTSARRLLVCADEPARNGELVGSRAVGPFAPRRAVKRRRSPRRGDRRQGARHARVDEVGPEIGGILVDICCELKGLEEGREGEWLAAARRQGRAPDRSDPARAPLRADRRRSENAAREARPAPLGQRRLSPDARCVGARTTALPASPDQLRIRGLQPPRLRLRGELCHAVRVESCLTSDTNRRQDAKVLLCSGAIEWKGNRLFARSEGSGACPASTVFGGLYRSCCLR